MGRILAVDYGLKRTGIASTDPSKIIATPLETIPTQSLQDYLKKYVSNEDVEAIVVGMPRRMDGTDSHITKDVIKFVDLLKNNFPSLAIYTHDERFTSKMAFDAMITGGMKKSERRKKENIDKISAAIILQSFMEQQSHG